MQERVSSSENGSRASGVHQSIAPSNAKRDLLAKFLRGELDEELTSAQTITRRALDTQPQLSFAQERLWFLDQLMSGSPVFNVPMAVRFRSVVDPVVLQRCVNEIVRRHEVFRTRFLTRDGKPSPEISADIDARLDLIDLTCLPESTRETECQRLTKAEALRSFDLEHGPLLRTSLIKLSDQESVFLLTMHHIVSDGWSILIFFRELAALYEAFSQGEASPLSEPSIQYADYALWQREWLRGDVLERQLSYWKEQLVAICP